jgi:UPF0755 protein
VTDQLPRSTPTGSEGWDELIAVPVSPLTRRESLALEPDRHGRKRPRRGRTAIIAAIVTVVLLAVAGGGLGFAYSRYPDQVKMAFGWNPDYTGHGTGSVTVTIHPGDLGSDIATTLASDGVTKTHLAFYDLLLKTTPQPLLAPGTYRLAHHMSAKSALAALLAPANRVTSTVAIPEGSTVAQILVIASRATGVPLADFTAAAKDYTALGVPAAAPRLEGFLFPATYEFQPKTTAVAMLKAMVVRMDQALDALGVPIANRLKVLTLAGLVQKEGNGTDDAKVARVFDNRLKQGILLQSDASVSYGAGGTTVVPTQKEYDDKNRYNTTIYKGLPIGPISNPGDVAIKAALHPATGKWIFFTTVNLETGETLFSTTNAEQDKAKAKFDAWLAAHPSYGK